MWMAGLTLPFISLTFLLLALTSPGTWGVALVFGWVTDLTLFSPPPPLHLAHPVSCLLCCRPISALHLAQQVSGIVMWNPVELKQSSSITYLLKKKIKKKIHCYTRWTIWTCPNLRRCDYVDRIRLHMSVHLEIIPSSEEKAVNGLAPAAKHVQQPWNVYNQAYTRAACDSIATRIRGQVFWAFVSLVSQHHINGEIKQHDPNSTEENSSDECNIN